MPQSHPSGPGDGSDVQHRLLSRLHGLAQQLPEGTRALRGIRGEELLHVLQETLEPERRRFAASEMNYQEEIDRLQRQLAVLRAEREEILAASDETRRYELPRLAAMVEVERSRSAELEQENSELSGRLNELDQRLRQSEQARTQEELEQEEVASEEDSHAEELLLDLDSRLHALEESQALSREHELQQAEEEEAAEEESFKQILEQYARTEERAARLSALEEAVWALADGEDEAGEPLESLRRSRTAERPPSAAVIELLRESLDRLSRQEAKQEELIGALRQMHELLGQEARQRAALEQRLTRLERRQRPPEGDVPWPLPEGASARDLNRVLEALRSEGELREQQTLSQIDRLSRATRAALERLSDLLDAALAGASGSELPIPLEDLDDLLAGQEAHWAPAHAQAWTPTVLPPYADEEELLPEELEPDEDPPAPQPEETRAAPAAATAWFEVETERQGQGQRSWPDPEAQDLGDEEPQQATWEDDDRDSVEGAVDRLLGQTPPRNQRPQLVDREDASEVSEVSEDELDLSEGLERLGLIEPVLDAESLLVVASDSESGDEDEPAAQVDEDWLSAMSEALEAAALGGMTARDPDTEPQSLEVPGSDDSHPEPDPPLAAPLEGLAAGLLSAPAPGELPEPLPEGLEEDLARAQTSEEASTRRLARGLLSAMRTEADLQRDLERVREERDGLESKAKQAEQALESEVWRGLATHRELLSARERLQQLEGRLEAQLRRVAVQPELEQVLDRGMSRARSSDEQLLEETANLRQEVEDRDSVLHWLLLDADPSYHDTKARAIRACEAALRELQDSPQGPQREAEEERVNELLHWLRNERTTESTRLPPVDF